MKNLKFGLMAMLLGLGLVITQSAFTEKRVPKNYVYVLDENGEFYNLVSTTGTLPLGNCVTDTEMESCIISYDEEQELVQYPVGEQPSGHQDDGGDGWYNEYTK